MTGIAPTRRGFIAAASAATILGTGPAAAQALAALREAAGKEGKVLWYDSLPRDQGETILKEFQKAFPEVKVAEYLEVPGAQKTARLTQESTAGGPTADVNIDAASAAMGFAAKGFLNTADWKAAGVEMSEARTPNEYLIAVTTPLYGVLYNTNKVKDAEAPKTYDEMLDAKWTGRIGTWARGIGVATLAAEWGEERTLAFTTKFAALKPKLYRSTYDAAASVGAGEIDLAYTIHHTAVPTMEKGAPVKFLFVEPIPMNPLYASLLKHGRNPNAGRLLAVWLGSEAGGLAYEKVAKRGNPFIASTETAKLIKGKKLAYFGAKAEVERAAWFNAFEARISRMLAGR